MSTVQLREIAELVYLESDCKRNALLARIQDWVNMPAIEAHRNFLADQKLKQEELDGKS